MPVWLWNCVIITVMVTTSGSLMSSFAQAKEPTPTFELDRIIELALERNPAIATARSVIEQNEGGQIQAGAYPNPRSPPSRRMPQSETPATEYVSSNVA